MEESKNLSRQNEELLAENSKLRDCIHILTAPRSDRAPRPEIRSERSDGVVLSVECARAAYRVWGAYCMATCRPQPTEWKDLPQESKDALAKEASLVLSGMPSYERHNSRMADKKADGWTYGLAEDAQQKTSPEFLPYGQLPQERRMLDALFEGAVSATAVALRGF